MDATAADVDVLVVGAGITGIYQLHRAREAGFSALLLEAGGGVGGTWFWNRYPGARFDSESYTYGYLFSEELFDEWEWEEHFAGQPEIERYLNHVVDKFDLRRDMRFDAPVTAGGLGRRPSATWCVTVADGTRDRARFLVAATGVLSVPYLPDVPGRDDFRGVQHHTGRVARASRSTSPASGSRSIGTSSSGVQVVPTILDDVASVTVYQRTANWCTPLNNRPITPEEQAELRAGLRSAARDAEHLAQRVRAPGERAAPASTTLPPSGSALFEQLWNSPGFMKLTSNYYDLLFNDAVNDEWCEFIAEKIRGIVRDPDTAERLIPKDHRFGGKRPPFVNGLLRGVQRSEGVARRSPRHAHRARRPRPGSRRPTACASSTSSCGRPASTSAPARSTAWASVGRDGLALDRALGRRPDDLPRSADPWVPQLLLPRRTARGGRQQPALQRRPGRHRHRHARVRDRSTATTSSR